MGADEAGSPGHHIEGASPVRAAMAVSGIFIVVYSEH